MRRCGQLMYKDLSLFFSCQFFWHMKDWTFEKNNVMKPCELSLSEFYPVQLQKLDCRYLQSVMLYAETFYKSNIVNCTFFLYKINQMLYLTLDYFKCRYMCSIVTLPFISRTLKHVTDPSHLHIRPRNVLLNLSHCYIDL